LVVKRAAQALPQRELNRTLLAVSLVPAPVFGVLSIAAWHSKGSPILSLESALFSLSAPGLALYAVLPGKKQPSARKLILFLGGSAGILFSLMSRNSLDLAGFLMLVLCGAMGAAIVHHLITVLVVPIIVGRIWCGWGRWSAMVFDLLPFSRSPGHLAGRWAALPAAALAITLCVAAVSCYGFGYRGMATLHSLPR
jgi:hypothetical protein